MPLSEEAAGRAVRFIELLKHTKGKWAGVPFTLMDWQRDNIVRPLFGTLREDGLRQYRNCYTEIPRKNGKSEIAAGVALYLLFADGEMGAEIYSAAADREQAAIVFNVAAQMVRQVPALEKRCKILDSTKRILVPSTGSIYRVLSADAFTKHGLNAHGVIFDELHAQPNRELWDVLTTSGGTREQPLIFAITTAGYDRHSICYEQHEYGEKILQGLVEDPTFLPVIYSAPDDADWQDEQVWHMANPALGAFRNIEEMRSLANKAKEQPALQNTFRRLYLNQWTSQETRWMDMDKWRAVSGPVDRDELEGRVCYGGLDLSSTTDITALVLTFPVDDTVIDADTGEVEYRTVYKWVPFFWIPEDNMYERSKRDRVPYEVWVRDGLLNVTPGNVIDYDYILDTIGTLTETYNLKEIAYDRWGATKVSNDLMKMGVTVVPFGQGFASMSGPSKELMNLTLQKRLHHGNNPVLNWMMNNVQMTQDPAGNLKPDKGRSRERIDGIVAGIMGLDRALRGVEGGGSVYDERGLEVL